MCKKYTKGKSMYKTKTAAFLVMSMLMFEGCASDGGSSTVGPNGRESTLSDNKIEGLYLFKIETNQNQITVRSGGNVKVGL